jgi:small-conductance mechanosensitive channel
VVLLLVCKAALWPAYLALLAWSRAQFISESTADADLTHALVSGLQVSAFVLWVGLLGRAILQQDGWGQRFWGLSAELCRFLRHVVTAAYLTALVLLVPYHILLTAPGDGSTAVTSLALARVLFLVFQGVVLVLVGIVGRRHSPLMAMILARSQQTQGLLWHLWPLVHVVLLAGVVTPITLHVLGYFYATRYIWSRVLESLGVILVLPLLIGVLVFRGLQTLQGYVRHLSSRMLQHRTDAQVVDRSFTIMRILWSTLLALLTISLILEIWGVSVTWLLTSPVTLQALRRAMIIALAIGLVMGVIQASNALTDYLLQPRTTRLGDRREAGRKLRTLAPLVQTIIRVAVIFIAVLVILEQLGINTGPILAGVGIFGLAVGFASQSLIKDVINGLFMLFEDSLSVGDVVTLRGTGGQVEKVTLRTVTIRDLSGSVHVIPNSTIDMVTNMTKDYSCYVLDVSVAYHEDVDTVIGILREIDEGMRHDPAYSGDMLEPLEVQGLERFADSAVIIRARLKTRPIQQWRIGREFNHRLKKVFDERGIEIPFPHRTLYWGNPKNGAWSPLPETVEKHLPPQRVD